MKGASGVPSHTTPHIDAVNQHESMDFRHAQGRIAKYLEVALTSEAKTIEEIIADEIRTVLGT